MVFSLMFLFKTRCARSRKIDTLFDVFLHGSRFHATLLVPFLGGGVLGSHNNVIQNHSTPSQTLSFTMVRLTTPTSVLSVFAGLDMALLALDHTAVPKRDLLASFIALAVMMEVLTWNRGHTKMIAPSGTPNPDMKRRLDKVFHTLSAIELLTTIIIPWAMILHQQFFESDRSLQAKEDSAIYILASHLFIFQTQIALESLIAAAGPQYRWMLFPFTIVANTYRLIPLLTWLSRSGYKVGQQPSTNNWQQQQHPLLWIGIALWLFSIFYFIPFEWWPVLQNARQHELHQ
jgi:hypothetical protein